MIRVRHNMQGGSVVLAALCFVAVMAIAIGTYLALCTQSMQLSNRSTQTTLSEHLAEMGLEVGIAAMNSSSYASWSSDGTNVSWSISGTTAYGWVVLPADKFGGVGVAGLINLQIDNYNIATNARPWDSAANYTPGDVVSCNGAWYKCTASNTGMQPPLSLGFWSAPVVPVIHAEGVVSLPDLSNPIKTQVVATLGYPAVFANALAGASSVTVSAGVTVDSYDSFAGYYGQITAPFTPLAPNTGYSAVLAGGSTTSYAVNLVGAVTVNGYLAAPVTAASPDAPNVSYDGSATVKGTAALPLPRVDLSRVSRSPYVPNLGILTLQPPTVLLPPLSPGGNITIGAPSVIIPTVYTGTDLNMSVAATTLTIAGPVVIDLTGDVMITGDNSQIVILPQGSLELRYAGVFTCSGLGVGVDNQTTTPSKFLVIGSGTATNTYSSAMDLYGAFYIPNAELDWTSGNLYGAISAGTISFGGGLLHYDASLRKYTVPLVASPFVINKWREIVGPTDPERVTYAPPH